LYLFSVAVIAVKSSTKVGFMLIPFGAIE
jgi:hypothetical protein